MKESVIVSAVRLPTGKFMGALSSLPAPELGAKVIREAVSRADLDPTEVDECIMGNVVSAGLGQAPARQAAIQGGLPDHVAALTINKVCGSGLKAVMLAAQGIATGDIDVAVAGGMESMSNCPHLLRSIRTGVRIGDTEAVDSMVHDGLWCFSLKNWSMGLACEAVVDKYRVSRTDQDTFAAYSHHKAAAAVQEGWFQDEILPIEIPQRKGDSIRLEHDESIRRDTSTEALSKLRPAFKPDGTVTAGNAPSVNDGAAALLIMSTQKAASLNCEPMARIIGQAVSGLSPKWILMDTGFRPYRSCLTKRGGRWMTLI